MRALVRAMKTLSDETRLRILSLLLERECCVCEVMQALDISQSTASRSLGVLYDAGFLKVRREGQRSYYSIIDGPHDFYLELVDVVRKALEGNQVVEADRERLKQTQPVIKVGGNEKVQ